MKWSLYIGKFAGIKVYIHWTFAILLAWIFIQYYHEGGWNMGLMGVLFILALFGCVTLHEFGHALVAKQYNFPTQRITLLPIGGVSQFDRMPEKPIQEFWVAVAGPAVNVVIAAALYLYLHFSGKMPELQDLREMKGFHFLFFLFVSNIMLVVFNLIPAFPMDGGRVLRALLSFSLDRSTATKVAASIGQFLAIVFVFVGIFYNIWLIFIGIFIYLGAGGEAYMEQTKIVLSGYKVRDALMTRFITLAPTDNIAKAIKLLLEGQDQEFLVGDGDNIAGVISKKEIIKAASQFDEKLSVSNVMRRDFPAFQPDMPLQDVYLKMMTTDHLLCPVFEDGHLLGVLDRENINELLQIREALKAHLSYKR